MNIEFRKSFHKDSIDLSAKKKAELAELIEKAYSAKTVFDIPNCKKMRAFKNAYRIKLGNIELAFLKKRMASNW